jgi:hypothetical protein
MPAVLFRTAPSRLAAYCQYVLWLIIGMVVAALVVTLWLSRWMGREEGLGWVSGRWLAELRRDRES